MGVFISRDMYVLITVYRCVLPGGHNNAHTRLHRDTRNKPWDAPTIQGCNHKDSSHNSCDTGGLAAAKAVHRLLRGKDVHAHGLTTACYDDSRWAWKTCARRQGRTGRGQVSCGHGYVWACVSVGKETHVSVGCRRFREAGQQMRKSKMLITLRWQQEFFSWCPPFKWRIIGKLKLSNVISGI